MKDGPAAAIGTRVSEETKPRRKRRSTAEVTNRLLQAAQEEFKRCGYNGATTAAIARLADSTEAQLFRTFSSKAQLFQEAIFRPLSAHLEQFNARYLSEQNTASMRDNARLYISELQQFLSEHAQSLLAVLTATSYGAEQENGSQAIDSLTAYFERGAAVQTRRIGENPRVDPRLMVRVSFAAVLGNVMFKDILFPEGLASDAAINDAIIAFVLDGTSLNRT